MFFLTNRILKVQDHTFTFDLTQNAPTNNFACGMRHGEGIYELLQLSDLIKNLRHNLPTDVLFFIHGFSSLPEEKIFPYAEKLAQLIYKNSSSIIVIPIIWPCDNDFGVIKDYWDDRKAAQMSGYAFARAILKYYELVKNVTSCQIRLNILAHSMGGEVLLSVLNILQHSYHFDLPRLFRTIFLSASDLPNTIFEKIETGQLMADVARNIVIYYAEDDLALLGSKFINGVNLNLSRRLGHTGPRSDQNIPNNIYSFDCNEFNNLYDHLGHTYFLQGGEKNNEAGILFQHIMKTLKTGRPTAGDSRRMILTKEIFV